VLLTRNRFSHDILILARDDWEVSSGQGASTVPLGSGVVDLGGKLGELTYQKLDWKFTHTPGIDAHLPDYLEGKVQSTEQENSNSPEFVEHDERGYNQRAWAKAIAGFELLGSARFIITDRLHGHIMSTIIGTPHVLMDSMLGKNLAFHDTWTSHCECTRVAPDFDRAVEVAKLYFESVHYGS